MSAAMDSSTEGEVVYVRLLDEGTVVYRPAPAERVGSGIYRLRAPDDYDSSDETWEFLPGSIVVCEPRLLSGGIALVAAHAVG